MIAHTQKYIAHSLQDMLNILFLTIIYNEQLNKAGRYNEQNTVTNN